MNTYFIVSRFFDLSASEIHALLKLRAEVFVTEQGWAHTDIEDVDLDGSSRHLLAYDLSERPMPFLGAARVIDEDGKAKLGRICLSPAGRGTGISTELMEAAVNMAKETFPDRDIVLDAQAPLIDFYTRHGFRAEGEPFELGGIQRQPMVLAAT
ncbi:MAG: GNAT family N-acetyltransferase [Corynebacterium sp.]|uniref:GNAT family N-acetyltransferase n=1 Tax=Corynebacterium sp. TaxID=1720 RepID=UPI0026DFEB56|nr:GNAT family N-acetyltransferase [Corynebacterium sp.]MDO5669346.1 GNAT family N-acetyltransferase [Corynebacterium sp.]